MKYGIVAIGYNRVDSMRRLLMALQQCEYGDDKVTLIISLDKWDSNEVVDCANEIQWTQGPKVVKTFSERQGLRKHILKCGGYMEEYDLDAIAVFEDDIVPSVDFYQFMRQAVPVYANEERIAGIGLYSFQWHPIANKPFCPIQGKSSVYLSQFAVSWGQIWLRNQWKCFTDWLANVDDKTIESLDIPEQVKSWKNSWLKFHIGYCNAKNKYFVYPYRSLATCFAEQGAHTDLQLNHYQVPIVEEVGTEYQFYNVDDIEIRYDTFFESLYLQKELLKKGYDVCVDLYGLKGKSTEKEFWLTEEFKPLKLVKSYGLLLKPHEKNILDNIVGEEIFLYQNKLVDSDVEEKFSVNKFLYYFNGSLDKRFVLFHLKKKIQRILKR